MRSLRLMIAVALVTAGCFTLSATAQVADRTFPTDGIRTVRISADGPLHVMFGAENAVSLHIDDKGPSSPPLRVSSSRNGSALTVSLSGPDTSVVPFATTTGYEIVATVPRTVALDVRDFSGNIEIDRVSAPTDVFAGDGNVSIAEADAPLTVEADAGAIAVERARSTLVVSTDTGNASATLDPRWRGSRVRMESTSGNLSLSVPDGFVGDWDVTSASGRVNNPMRSVRRATPVFMLTESGNIDVVRR